MSATLKFNSAKDWTLLTMFSFLIVGIYGLLMRLKFLFPLPFLDQKNLMHAHSHFAFSGWVSQAIMIFLILIVTGNNLEKSFPKCYRNILLANFLASLGMLISFTITGYAFLSITFSSLVVLVSYWFAIVLWKDLNRSSVPKAILILIKAAVIYNVLSSIGTFALVYLKVTYQLDPLKQLASVYFYLHFQYNGWFFFGCFGLLNHWIFKKFGQSIISPRFSWLYISTVVPAYFLSVLWWKGFPNWLYGLLLLTVLVQIFLWAKFLIKFFAAKKKTDALQLSKVVFILWSCVAFAVCIKLILQAISIIPALSQLVYGFRPIVIAYLHLVLLVIISLFLLGYAFNSQALKMNKGIGIGVYGLLLGIFLNEFVLMIQGIGGLMRHSFQRTHETLGIAAIIIVISICLIIHKQIFCSPKAESLERSE